MKLKITVSTFMDKNTSVLGSIEDQLIRVPKLLREKLDIETGFFLRLKGSAGTLLLQTSIAYKADALNDNTVAYVSSSTFNLLSAQHSIKLELVNDITIGCDPEFHLLDSATGFNVSARHFFSNYGELGNDCGLAEIRPRPSTKPKEVVNNISILLQQAHKKLVDSNAMRKYSIVMAAASHMNGMSAGFHIHFGLPKQLLTITSKHWRDVIVDVLDYYVGVSAVLPEGNDDYIRRSTRFSRYGKPGDYRWDRTTLEYRVPGGHLLRHPILTHGILSIAKIVIQDVLSRLSKISKQFSEDINVDYQMLHALYPTLPTKEIIANAITSEDINEAVKHFKPIVKSVSKMFGYEVEKLNILRYYSYVASNLLGKKAFDFDIRHNWRLKDEVQQRQMAIYR